MSAHKESPKLTATLRWRGLRAFCLLILDVLWETVGGRRRRRILLVAPRVQYARYLAKAREVLLELDPGGRIAGIVPTTALLRSDYQRVGRMLGVPILPARLARYFYWDVVLTGVPSELRLKGVGRCVFIDHGIFTGKGNRVGEPNSSQPVSLRADGRPFFDVVLTKGRAEEKILRKISPGPVPQFRMAGDLILDDLLVADHRREELRARAGILPQEKVVAFMSTWGPDSLIAECKDHGMEVLARLARQYRLLFFSHPNNEGMLHEPSCDYSSFLRELGERGIRVISPEEDWSELLVMGDVGVSDHTSLALYYLQLGRPLLYVKLPRFSPLPGSPFDRLAEIQTPLGNLGEVESRLSLTGDRLPQDRARVQALSKEVCEQVGNARELHRQLFAEILGIGNGETDAG